MLGLRNISFAIWLIGLPEASSHITRYSRSESVSCGGFWASGASSTASLSASDALTYLPPPTTLRMAAASSSPALSLFM